MLGDWKCDGYWVLDPPCISGTQQDKFLCFSAQDSSCHQRKEDDNISKRHSDHRWFKLASVKPCPLHWLQRNCIAITALIWTCWVTRFWWNELGPLYLNPAVLIHRAESVEVSQICQVMGGLGKMNRKGFPFLSSQQKFCKSPSAIIVRFQANKRWWFSTQGQVELYLQKFDSRSEGI